MKTKKVKVIEMFRDKYTNEVYELNHKMEVDEKRYEEIKEYVEEIKDNKKKGE